MTSDIDYSNKVVLAPMVRVGVLPFRLTALEYGADLVWTEELVDKRVIGSVRKYNPVTKAIEYWKGDRLTFSTCEEERGRVIFQLGTADPDLALQAALTVKDDVAGIDVNCGCPKKFSIQGGMGAALLTNPDRLRKILTNLVQNLDIPVTCKIRLLETEEETLKLVKMIESTGVRALTVHCRTKEQRSSTAANWEAFKAIAATVKSIPVIVNGDVNTRLDIPRIKEITNADSFMIARGAQHNPSAFLKEGPLPLEEVIQTYIKKCIDLDNMHQNTKYVLLTMYTDPKDTRSERYTKLQRAKSMLAICEIYGLVDYYNEVQALHEARRKEIEQEKRQTEEQEQKKEGDADQQTDDKITGQKREALADDSELQSKKPKVACT